MNTLTAQWIAEAVGGVLAADADTAVTSVHLDTRQMRPGGLYVARVGENADGHDYVEAATAAGAVLHLVERPVDAPHVRVENTTLALGALARAYLRQLRAHGDITVVGITGSNGKTTTKDLLAQMLPDAVAPEGSFNNETGLPLTVLRADDSTRHLVLEMGASQPGDLAYLTDIAPLDVAVVLTVGTAHAQFYPTPADLAVEKASILDGLVPGGVAVLAVDDARVAAMRERVRPDARVLTCGLAPHADVRAAGLDLDAGRPRFTVTVGDAHADVAMRLLGEHHVTNGLAALTVALACGQDLESAAASLSAAVPLSAHRMALTVRADGVRVLDDSYNASPESMRAALRALLEVAQGGPTWAVIGEMREMGDASWQAHADIGHDVVRLNISRLVVVGEGARPAFDSAVREGSWGQEAIYVATIGEARDLLDAQLAPGDTVLVKASHGSHLWQVADHLVEGRA